MKRPATVTGYARLAGLLAAMTCRLAVGCSSEKHPMVQYDAPKLEVPEDRVCTVPAAQPRAESANAVCIVFDKTVPPQGGLALAGEITPTGTEADLKGVVVALRRKSPGGKGTVCSEAVALPVKQTDGRITYRVNIKAPWDPARYDIEITAGGADRILASGEIEVRWCWHRRRWHSTRGCLWHSTHANLPRNDCGLVGDGAFHAPGRPIC